MATATPKTGLDKTNPEPVSPVDPRDAIQAGNGQFSNAEVVGVDKIRDLLFGNQMQDYDRRFSKLEERFHQRFKEIEADTTRNLSAFESNAKKQIDSLASQLREEKDVRSEADKETDRALREQHQSLEKRLRSISDQLNQLERDTADRLTQEAQALRDEIKRRNEDTHHTLEKMFAELANVKTDRNLLAGLFIEVAKCLNQEAGPKNAGGGAGATRSWPPA